MRVRRVLESCLYATELEECSRFYREVLGLEPISAVEGRHAFFRCGPGVLLLFQPERTREESGDVPPHGAIGPGHLAFAVPEREIDGWRRRLGELGVAVEREVSWPKGGRSLYLRDPAGNSVELAAPAIWGIEDQEE